MDRIFRNIIDKFTSSSSNGSIKLQKAVDIIKQASLDYDATRVTVVLNKSKGKSYSILDSLKNMRDNGWISCNDHLPEPQDIRQVSIDDCTEYLVQRRSGSMDIAHFITVYGESYFEANCIELKDVVAWQPRILSRTSPINMDNEGWIYCSDSMPPEHESIFARFKGTPKWTSGMFEKTSDVVNVTVMNSKGDAVTTHATTTDGRWSCDLLKIDSSNKIIAWRPLPKPCRRKGE